MTVDAAGVVRMHGPADAICAATTGALAMLGFGIGEATMCRRSGGRGEVWLIGLPGSAQELSVDELAMQKRLAETLSANELSAGRPQTSRVTVELYRATPLSTRGMKLPRPGAVMAVGFAVPRAWLDELDAYYEHEHTPLLLAIPGWQRIRRWALEPVDGGDQRRLALHDLADVQVASSPRVRATTETPWYRRLMGQEWFSRGGRPPGIYLDL